MRMSIRKLTVCAIYVFALSAKGSRDLMAKVARSSSQPYELGQSSSCCSVTNFQTGSFADKCNCIVLHGGADMRSTSVAPIQIPHLMKIHALCSLMLGFLLVMFI